MARIRTILAVQSPISRAIVGRLLARLPWVELVGEAASVAEALTLLPQARPEIAVLGAGLAASREADALRTALVAGSCRWIEVAGRTPIADASAAALDPRGLPLLSAGLADHEATLALRTVLAAPIGTALPAAPRAPPDAAPPVPQAEGRFLLIGASTGGVDALLEILATFPADCPPTAIVQHTGRGNAASLIQLLGQTCKAEVVAPRDGMELQSGMVCIAAGGDQHLRIRAGSSLRCLLHRSPPVTGHLPSVDVLFQSATAWADRVVAVLLTGMGRDGAAGLAALRKAGATTIAQDEATSLVYGMPRAAWELGAVEQLLPLSEIAQAALNATRREAVR